MILLPREIKKRKLILDKYIEKAQTYVIVSDSVKNKLYEVDKLFYSDSSIKNYDTIHLGNFSNFNLKLNEILEGYYKNNKLFCLKKIVFYSNNNTKNEVVLISGSLVEFPENFKYRPVYDMDKEIEKIIEDDFEK